MEEDFTLEDLKYINEPFSKKDLEYIKKMKSFKYGYNTNYIFKKRFYGN